MTKIQILTITVLGALLCTPALAQKGGKGHRGGGPGQIFAKLDTDKDGKISKAEAKGTRLEAIFDKLDADSDGSLSKQELAKARGHRKGKGKRRRPAGGKGE